ncbi:MAG: hypothetical protein AUI50_03675 [Crenarchaeota archaeon 13_1_40CM_2_52_14]|nr:MAG: hypothetical protein AUI97_00355 [Crenarchaeota archaeon 13_1_40CM_3_52_17]OLD35083.1 MAG: hypothetical protein AUI50_03675 [Crenarchaeota archaeon 13_1_40CM_2_52_14]OLE71264.1 MAG: hypothetical protein AUF78_02940 [archaeon 13_1_20CM_2_51_12]
MRFRQSAFLGTLLLLTFSISATTDNVSGQSTPIDIAQNKIVQAFQIVNQADLDGASPAAISQLASNLNLALSYEQSAIQLLPTNKTGSGVYASLSLNMSTTTAVQALNVASAARTQTLLSQLGDYSLAVASGLGSTLLVIEFHRVKNFVRRVRLRRLRLD